MIKNPEQLKRIEDELVSHEHLTLEQRFALLDGLYEEARLLGRFNESDMLDGVEDDFRLAFLLNAVVHDPSRKDRARA